jgi:hypothetical protein
MEADQWISLASLGVAGLAIGVGPYVAGRVSKAQHIAERRIETYAEAAWSTPGRHPTPPRVPA